MIICMTQRRREELFYSFSGSTRLREGSLLTIASFWAYNRYGIPLAYSKVWYYGSLSLGGSWLLELTLLTRAF